jgi:general secretion pathway protein A
MTFGVLAWALVDGRLLTPASANASKQAASAKPAPASVAPSASAALSTASQAPAGAALDWDPLIRSERDAWRELASAWNVALPEGDPCQAAPREQLQCFRSSSGDLALIRRLDRPTILTLYEDGGSKPLYALLTGLSDRAATLRAGQETQTVSLAALAGVWRGEFATLWRTPPGYGQRGSDIAGGPVRDWLTARLDKLAGAMPSLPAATSDLKSRVAAFQLAQGLKPDGLAGPITYMQLNRAAGVEEPRLHH